MRINQSHVLADHILTAVVQLGVCTQAEREELLCLLPADMHFKLIWRDDEVTHERYISGFTVEDRA